MDKRSLFDRVPELKERFRKFFQHRKKIAALENYSTTVNFSHKNYLTLVKECLKDGFLGEKEAEFLDYMLACYEVNYLDWAHKTKWLKTQMNERAQVSHKLRPYQILFDFDRVKETPVHVPTALIAMQQSQPEKRV